MKKRSAGIVVFMTTVFLLAVYFSMTGEELRGVQQVQYQPSSLSIDLQAEDYANEVENIINAIDKKYAHKDRKQIDIKNLRDTYIVKAESAHTLFEFNRVLLQLFAELENCHSNVAVPMNQYGLPVAVDLIEEKVVVRDIKEQYSKESGINKGWVVKKIDDIDAGEWLESRFSMISGSTEQALWQESLKWVFKRYEDEPEGRKYLLESPAGVNMEKELLLDTPKNQPIRQQRMSVETEDLGDYGYIGINTMADGVVEDFDEALVTMKDKEGIILDLRNNGGGNSLNGDNIFRRFIQEKTRIWQGRSIKPFETLSYSGDIIALVGPQTFSAAESFAFNLYDSGRATIIGETTRGDSGGGPTSFRTEGGIYFRMPTRGLDYSASGLPMEGFGLVPHIRVVESYHDFLNGEDRIVEKAIRMLEGENN